METSRRVKDYSFSEETVYDETQTQGIKEDESNDEYDDYLSMNNSSESNSTGTKSCKWTREEVN